LNHEADVRYEFDALLFFVSSDVSSGARELALCVVDDNRSRRRPTDTCWLILLVKPVARWHLPLCQCVAHQVPARPALDVLRNDW
jgi:hypothetical protein